jgi:RNA polymerase sigma factor (sigma-70 family)
MGIFGRAELAGNYCPYEDALMHKYRSPSIAELAAQVKRGPTRLRLRQLYNIDFLLSVVEPSKRYPRDFVLHALTGFRARAGNGQGTGGRLIDGELLRGDLVTLAEELSEDARIPADGWPERLHSVTELAHRFDVSSKTVFRWHRRGLIGWRLRFPDQRARLAFPEHCVRRFVAENVDLVNRGSNFSQLTKAERARIIAAARGLATKGDPTINAVAREIAAETGRAVETIRLILKRYDEAHPKDGIFNRSKLEVPADDRRLAVWEAYVDGASIEALSHRFGRSVRWIYRAVTQMRARELRARKIEYVPSDEFGQPNAGQEILGDASLAAPSGDATPSRRVPADLPPYLQELFRIPLLTPEGERALFRKLNYLKHRAAALAAALDPETAKARELDAIDDLLAEAERVKKQITQANLRLVVSIAKRHVKVGNDFFELVSDGNVSLMRAVDKFDYSRGFKFSTYASWALMKNYARTLPEHRRRRERFQTGRDELLGNVAGPEFDEAENDYLATVRSTLERMLDTLDHREQSILRQRFGLEDRSEPQTLEQIGRRFGVSKERIRQLESRAMARLRDEFESDVEQLLSV